MPLARVSMVRGIKLFGDGRQPASTRGVQGRRQGSWMHLAVDTVTSDIGTVEATSGNDGDNLVSQDLLDQISEDEDIGAVTVDGAHDPGRCQTAIIDRAATAVFPIRRYPANVPPQESLTTRPLQSESTSHS